MSHADSSYFIVRAVSEASTCGSSEHVSGIKHPITSFGKARHEQLLNSWSEAMFCSAAHHKPLPRRPLEPVVLGRSEGLPLTGYFVLGHDGAGARWPEQNYSRRRRRPPPLLVGGLCPPTPPATLAQRPWLGDLGSESLAKRPWLSDPGAATLAQRPWLMTLAQRPWLSNLGSETSAQRPWLSDPGSGDLGSQTLSQ